MLEAAIDLHAAIIPSFGAGGIHLGMREDQLPDEMKPTQKTTNDWNNAKRIVTNQRYECSDLVADCKDGIVDGLHVRKGYQGLFDGFLGIGTTVLEIVRRYGPVAEDDEDVLVIPGVPGLWYSVDCLIDEPAFIHLPVDAIGIFSATAELQERFRGLQGVATTTMTIYHHPLPPGFEFVGRWR